MPPISDTPYRWKSLNSWSKTFLIIGIAADSYYEGTKVNTVVQKHIIFNAKILILKNSSPDINDVFTFYVYIFSDSLYFKWDQQVTLYKHVLYN